MKWIYSEGGPLLLVESRLLSEWHGSAPSQQGDHSTDYDRACALDGYIGVIELPSGSAIVLGGEPLQTAVWKNTRNELTLVRWSYAESEESFLEALRHFPDDPQWDPETIEFSVGDEELVVFDSALTGEEMLESLKIRINPGRYRGRVMAWEPNETTALIVHEFRRL